MITNEFKVNYNVTGEKRKDLVKAISEITGAKAEYLKAPTFAYLIDYMKVSKDGVLSFDDRADTEEVEHLLEELERRGFHAAPPEKPDDPEPKAEEAEKEKPLVGVTVSYPRSKIDDKTLDNFIKLAAAKEKLIKKAFGVDELPIQVTEDKVILPWFQFDPDNLDCLAYAAFIEKMVDLARTLKRVNAREKPVENEKYAFRCFLLRLGMVGNEWKETRKVLLQNLSGSSAFKGGASK